MIAIASLVLVFLKKVIRSSDLRNLGCKLFETDDGTATAMIRLVLGVVFFAHGAQKMLGWLGGFGFSATMGFLRARCILRPHSPSWRLAAQILRPIATPSKIQQFRIASCRRGINTSTVNTALLAPFSINHSFRSTYWSRPVCSLGIPVAFTRYESRALEMPSI